MKPSDLGERIRNLLVTTIADLQEFISGVDWWNTNRRDAPPMDCERERVLLQYAKKCLALWDEGKTLEVGRIAEQMLKVASKAAEQNK